MRTLYNILFLVFFGLTSPYYFWRLRRRGDWMRDFGQRFAIYDAVHQAGADEPRPDLAARRQRRRGQSLHATHPRAGPRAPNLKIVVSCTTTTGMAELRRRLPTHVTKIYYPIDRRKFVRRALATIDPQVIVLVEAEIWPNFLWRARDLGIPLFLVNARLSDRSYPRYKKFGWLFRPLFASFDGVGCQNEEDAQRLRDVGCRPETVQIVGNLKFDAAGLSEKRRLNVRALLRQIAVPDDALILVAGSTHQGEEILLTDMAARLRQKFPKLFLVLVPRHFERCNELGQRLKSRGVKFILRNAIFASTQLRPGEVDCLLVNTTGELKFFYEQADVVFVGKSLKAIGGQNPIEPGALGKAIVFGPNMQNFTDITRNFLQKDAAVQVKDEAELERALAELLANPARRAELGRHALEVVAENLGAVERTVEMILPQLARRNIYIVPKK